MALQTSQIKRTKSAKLHARIASEAIRIAKKKNDKMVIKAMKYKRLWKGLQEKLINKYKTKARAKVYSKK